MGLTHSGDSRSPLVVPHVTDVERIPGTYQRRRFPDDSVGRWFATDFGRQP